MWGEALNLRWLIFDYVPPGIKLTPQQRHGFRRKVKDADVPISWKTELLGFVISIPLILVWIIFLYLISLAIPLNGARLPLIVAGIWVILTQHCDGGLPAEQPSWLCERWAMTFASIAVIGFVVSAMK